jgi:hypothetical protein
MVQGTPQGVLTTGITTTPVHNATSSRRNTTMATATHHDMKITEAELSELKSDLGDRMIVLVTLEDDSKRRLLDAPTGRVHLEPRNLVGRTFAAAYAQAMCWLEAADDGIHRIVSIEKIGAIAEDDPDRHGYPGLNGNWEVVVRMSDGSVTRAFAYYDDELRITDEDAEKLLDLSLKQAVEFKVQLDVERVPDGFNHPDYSKVFVCFCCGKRH